MIYYAIFGEDELGVMNFEGWELATYSEKDLETVKRKVFEDMRKLGTPFALIFTLTPDGPVRLSFLSLEDEVVKALGRWFK